MWNPRIVVIDQRFHCRLQHTLFLFRDNLQVQSTRRSLSEVEVLQHRRYDRLKLEHIASTLHRIEHILYEVFLKILLACICEQHSPLPLPSQHCVSMLHRFSFKHKCTLVFQAILPSITTLLHFAFLSEMFTLFLGVSHPLRESRVPYTIPQETESHSY